MAELSDNTLLVNGTPSKLGFRMLGASIELGKKLQLLSRVAQSVTDQTGVPWQITSHVRESPGHKDGDSLDIAPRPLVEAHEKGYAAQAGSDPVLFLRPTLLGALMTLALERQPYLGRYIVLVAVENDHLHLQLGIPDIAAEGGRIIPFPFGKDMTHRYPDSLNRIRRFTVR